MSKHLTPAEVVERMFGGPERVGSHLGLHPKAPYVWRRGSQYREAGDFPSGTVMRQLMGIAKEKGVPLKADHLIFGMDEAELEKLLDEQVAA